MQQIIIFLLFLIASPIALSDAECKVRSASSLVKEHDVGKVTGLEKDTLTPGKCTVFFHLTVDGEDHLLTGTYEGWEQTESLCRIAIDNARSNLLVELGGTFATDSVTVCDEGETDLVDNVQIGDTILENEVSPSKIKGYFNYHNARCRMFTQSLVKNRIMRVYNGVICEVENSHTNWIVVDKW